MSTIYPTPTSYSSQVGNGFYVNINGFPETQYQVIYDGTNYYSTEYGATRVYGAVTFPPNLLQVNSVTASNSAFNWQPNISVDNVNGRINFNNRSLGTSGQTVNILTIIFIGTSPGTATVGLAPGTRYDIASAALSSANYAITAAPPPPPPASASPPPPSGGSSSGGSSSGGSSSGGATSGGSSSSSPGKTSSGGSAGAAQSISSNTSNADGIVGLMPTVQMLTDGNTDDDKDGFGFGSKTVTRGYDKAQVIWVTTRPSVGTFVYGETKNNLDKTAKIIQLPDESYSAELTGLTPGKQYYFKISSEQVGDSSKTAHYTGTFTTKGYPVSLVFNAKPKISNNLKVTLNGKTFVTNKTGVLNLEFASGKYVAKVGDQEFSFTVKATTIPETGVAPAVQAFQFTIKETPSALDTSASTALQIGIGFVVLLLLAGIALWWLKRHRDRKDDHYDSSGYGVITSYDQSAYQQSWPQEYPAAAPTQYGSMPEPNYPEVPLEYMPGSAPEEEPVLSTALPEPEAIEALPTATPYPEPVSEPESEAEMIAPEQIDVASEPEAIGGELSIEHNAKSQESVAEPKPKKSKHSKPKADASEIFIEHKK